MKVVIQNGAARTLSRKQAEAIVALLPASWCDRFDSLTLYQGNEPSLEIKHYPQARSIGVVWPGPLHPQPSAVAATKELIVAMAVVLQRGELPRKLSESVKAHAEQQASHLLAQCAALLSASDA